MGWGTTVARSQRGKNYAQNQSRGVFLIHLRGFFIPHTKISGVCRFYALLQLASSRLFYRVYRARDYRGREDYRGGRHSAAAHFADDFLKMADRGDYDFQDDAVASREMVAFEDFWD